MTADNYLLGILQREWVDTGPYSAARGVQSVIEPTIRRWGGRYIESISPSGSFAKGTAVKTGTDIDLFISVSAGVADTLEQIYEKVFAVVQSAGYAPKRQNVSIGINVAGQSVDLVPAKRQDYVGQDHSLWRRRASTWTKTNVATHVWVVAMCGFLNEIKVVKLWRNQKQLDFPSFYLELSVIRALRENPGGSLSSNVLNVLHYLSNIFESARIVDPANTNNIISDDLTVVEKRLVSIAAQNACAAKTWEDIIR